MVHGPYRPARVSFDMIRDDLGLIDRMAHATGTPMPLTELTRRRYDDGAAQGWGDGGVAVAHRLAALPPESEETT